MDSRTGFGGMVDTSSSYFEGNRHSIYTHVLYLGKLLIHHIIFLGKTGTAGTHSKLGMVPYQGSIHIVGIVRNAYRLIGKVVLICLGGLVNLEFKFQGQTCTTTETYDFNPNELKFHRGSPSFYTKLTEPNGK